jgi:hypothetical protein
MIESGDSSASSADRLAVWWTRLPTPLRGSSLRTKHALAQGVTRSVSTTMTAPICLMLTLRQSPVFLGDQRSLAADAVVGTRHWRATAHRCLRDSLTRSCCAEGRGSVVMSFAAEGYLGSLSALDTREQLSATWRFVVVPLPRRWTRQPRC